MRSRRGFTLIELSIVLVIIGLITGSVLIGRDLIHAAEIRSVVSDIEKFNTAANTFEAKYNCLPGDCPNATQFFGQWSDCGNSGTLDGTTCNGNGDGWIGTAWFTDANAAYYDEMFWFWQHLTLAGLIPGTYSGWDDDFGYGITNVVPASKLRGVAYHVVDVDYPGGQPSDWWLTWPANNAYVLAYTLNIGGIRPAFTPDEAFAIDSKLDDGMPGTGIVRLFSAPSFSGGLYEPYCATNDSAQTAVYNIATYGGQVVCNYLWIRAAF